MHLVSATIAAEEIMAQRIVEHLTGEGSVYRKDGNFVANVEYELQVVQELVDASTKPEFLQI